MGMWSTKQLFGGYICEGWPGLPALVQLRQFLNGRENHIPELGFPGVSLLTFTEPLPCSGAGRLYWVILF